MAKKNEEKWSGKMLDKLPAKLPEGLQRIQVKGTVSEGTGDDRKSKSGVLTLIVPERSNAGVVAYQKYREANGAPDGDTFVADAIIAAVRSQTVSSLKIAEMGDSAKYLPDAPNTRTVDAASAAGDALADFIRENGRGPNAEELAEIYGGLVPTA